MSFTHSYICRTCKKDVPCHPADPKLDEVKMILVEQKDPMLTFEFSCLNCSEKNPCP